MASELEEKPDLTPERLAEMLAMCEAAGKRPSEGMKFFTTFHPTTCAALVREVQRLQEQMQHYAADEVTFAATKADRDRLAAENAEAIEALCCCPPNADEGCGCRSATLPELIAGAVELREYCDKLTAENAELRTAMLECRNMFDGDWTEVPEWEYGEEANELLARIDALTKEK